MSHRLLSIIVVLCWAGSMSWLVSTKIIPPILKGQAPTYQTMLPTVASSETVRWKIQLNGQHLGTAENHIRRNPDGIGSVNTTVNLERFSVDDMLNEMMERIRIFSFFDRTPEKVGFGKIDLKIESELLFDVFGELNRFASNVSIDELDDFIQLEGTVNDDKLRLIVYTNTYAEDPARKMVYDSTMTIPRGTLLTDTFSPQPRLARLRVGQSWTFRRYQPLRPANPIEMMEAMVERRDAIDWGGETVSVHVVVVRRESSGAVTAAREPLGYVWALEDGSVVRQETKVGSMNIVFERIPDSSIAAEHGPDTKMAENAL